MQKAWLRSALLPVTLAVALAGCGGGTFDLQIYRDYDCVSGGGAGGAPSDYLVVRVTGDDMDPLVFEGPSQSISFDPIPAGKNRVVRIQAFSSSDKRVQNAAGHSAPFDVDGGSTENLRIHMYPVNNFSLLADAEGRCATLRQARAGHSAVALRDGRVLVAGGFEEADRDGGGQRYLNSAEIYDPKTGTFRQTTDMPGARAFAEGVRLHDGRVMLIGGEWQEGNVRRPLDEAVIYDPSTETWERLETRFARKGHSVTYIEDNQQVLVVGGVGLDGRVVASMEYYNPNDKAFYAIEPTTGGGSTEQAQGAVRAFHVAAAVDTKNVVLAGGIDAEGEPTRTITLIRYANASSGYLIQANNPSYRLENPAVSPAGFITQDDVGRRFVLAGGYGIWEMGPDDPPAAGIGSEFSRRAQIFQPFGSDRPVLRDLGEPVGVGACGVGFGEQGVVAGGLGLNFEPRRTSFSFNLAAGDQPARRVNLMEARGYATCTELGDGRALVIGGLRRPSGGEQDESSSGGLVAIPSVEIFNFITSAP